MRTPSMRRCLTYGPLTPRHALISIFAHLSRLWPRLLYTKGNLAAALKRLGDLVQAPSSKEAYPHTTGTL